VEYDGFKYRIFVRRFPERNSGYVVLPVDSGEKEIRLGTSKEAHVYSGVDPAKWIEIFKEDRYFTTDDQLRPPVFSYTVVEDEKGTCDERREEAAAVGGTEGAEGKRRGVAGVRRRRRKPGTGDEPSAAG
jgi:hypothetical protein